MVDSNAGKLSRWLRLIGYDTEYFSAGPDKEMIDRARSEDRIVLTRDTRILRRRAIVNGQVKALLLKDDDPENQLKQVVNAFNLDYSHKPLSLCLECNRTLVAVTPQEAHDLVPPHVFQAHKEFFRCPVCRRIYWAGSHKRSMEAKLKKLMHGGRE